MASSPFRNNVIRVMHEAREHGDHHDAAILFEALELLDEGRYDQLPERLALLRPIFRARVGAPPAMRPDGGDGNEERPPGVASS